MLVKIVTFFCFVTAAAAIALQRVPVAKPAHAEPHYPALYEYEYSVQDEHNGDIKQQKENRDGDKVHGFYSVVQPDGVRRVVEYTADKEHGFNAVVRYEGHPHAPAVSDKTPVTKVSYSAPAPKATYAAPVSKVHISAPVAKVTFRARAPVVYAAAPVAKVAYASPAHVVYGPAISKVAFTSHLGHVYSYHH